MRRLIVIVSAFACLLTPVAFASTAGKGNTAAQDIAWFNAQRAANGIPAGITEKRDWSAKCDQHITYMEKTNTFGHDEDQSSPFYTDAGNWGGTNSVLAMGSSWSADSNPWETAPIHLAQLMAPELAEMGVADRDGYVCATTWPGMDRELPDANTVVTYPGDGTTTYPSESASELPFTPEDIVGLTKPTGPNLYVYEWGPVLSDYTQASTLSIASASVTGPHGAVPVKWVDATTTKVGPYLPPGSGIIMPVAPLKPGASYQASVSFSDGTTHTWSFKTQLLSNYIMIRPGVAIVRRRMMLMVAVRSAAPNLTIIVSYHGKPLKLAWKTVNGAKQAVLTKDQRRVKVCAASGGGTSGYQPTQTCRTV